MTKALSPHRAANDLTRLLNAVLGAGSGRFPVNVATVAKDYSHHLFPDDPISMVKGADLPGFDGALCKAPPSKKGWGIVYNDAISSTGRQNFTLGHEFGHYLLHREAFPDGIECGAQDIVRWDEAYNRIEQQANVFAAGLLMPLDDFRRQIDGRGKPTLDDIGGCADRYGVSLIAATLRWLEYTERRSVLVISRDGYILWARSSDAALRSGAYFKTVGRAPIAIPDNSLPMRPDLLTASKGALAHESDSWLAEPCEELALLSDQYDFAISLLHLGRERPRWEPAEEEEDDTFDKFAPRLGFRLLDE